MWLSECVKLSGVTKAGYTFTAQPVICRNSASFSVMMSPKTYSSATSWPLKTLTTSSCLGSGRFLAAHAL